MKQETAIVLFKEQTIRRTWHNDEWWFVIEALTNSTQPAGYLKDMRRRDPQLNEGWGQIAPTPFNKDIWRHAEIKLCQYRRIVSFDSIHSITQSRTF